MSCVKCLKNRKIPCVSTVDRHDGLESQTEGVGGMVSTSADHMQTNQDMSLVGFYLCFSGQTWVVGVLQLSSPSS